MPSFRHFALLYKEQGLCYSKRMSKNNEKTNVCRLLDGKKLAYVEHTYPPEEAVSAEEVAAYLGQNPAQVFKTLVTVGKSGQHYVFVIPGPASLSLKSAAKAVGEKSVAMLPQRELLPLTGYVHGGCSPIGMKRFSRRSSMRAQRSSNTSSSLPESAAIRWNSAPRCSAK